MSTAQIFRNFKIQQYFTNIMIQREELEQILNFVAKRWLDMIKEPNKVMETLPSNFWMNSVGGKAGKGRWITALMYTENESDANAFKEVLLRWQTKGIEKNQALDLIQIGKKK
jgi:hypothetical protein